MDQPRDARNDASAASDSSDAPVAGSRGPRRHDQTYKLLFAQPEAARSLTSDVLARRWSDELDMETLERFPTEHMDAELRRSLSDMAWRVWFKGGERSAVFLVEFQSSVDEDMALRMRQYVTDALNFLRADPRLLDADEFLPLIGAYEVYTGPGRSTAKRSVQELFKLPEVPPGARGQIVSFPSCDYVGVDLQRMHGAGLLARDTVVEWVGALEREPLASLPRVHASLLAHLDGSAWGFRDALAKWTGERLRAVGMPSEVRDQIEERIVNPRERPEMAQTWQEWIDVKSAEAVATARTEALAEGLARGLADGEAKARAQLVVRQVTRRFGAETGERLAELVESMGAEELARVGDLVVDCGTGDELLSRASNGVSTHH